MERKELIARLRKDALEHKEVAHCCDCPPENTQNWKHMQTCLDAADMLEADVQPAVPQEPVAKRSDRTTQEFMFGMRVLNWNRAQQDPPIDIGRELWTADEIMKLATPQPQPRLTDEEIDSVPFNGFTDLRQRFESENECLRAFARAIEKKVRGEK